MKLTLLGGIDYGGITTNLTFAIGVTSQCIDISIFEDNALEGNQSFQFVLSSNDRGVALFENSTSLITIMDNDGT